MSEEFNVKARFLMGTGPSDVNSRVLRAMEAPMIGHLDPQFILVMDEVMEII
jgi:alanine-glyoxylate transaminase/serine-glyoxylate transaminase/serine-pyruvate transaminase